MMKEWRTIGAGSLLMQRIQTSPGATKPDSRKRCAMQAMTNEEFAAQVAELAKHAGLPQPTAVYDPDGDCIEFLAKPEPFYAERIDDLVTVYYSQERSEEHTSEL